MPASFAVVDNPCVALVKASYEDGDAPGLDSVERALRRAALLLGWHDDDRGPLADVILPGAKVLVKPNLVLHANQGQGGIHPLVTHPCFIKAAVAAALEAGASEVIVGDAPIQGCDLGHLLEITGLKKWADEMMLHDRRFKGIRDFRRTTCVFKHGVRVASEDRQAEDRFVLFDLGRNSLLEPITERRASFRVTLYDPRLMAKTHAPGRHQYLVAKDVMDADVIINLPKLKTHKKAGMTCALKNVVGINGNKEFLPHHRVGGSDAGGDCYPGRNMVKRALEHMWDLQNSMASPRAGLMLTGLMAPLYQMLKLSKDRIGIEGSWSGNDTIWRTCLDLNRILLYGRTDASLSETVQRRVVHVVDAVIAGQGDGPLAPDPLPLNMILVGNNPVAVDYIGAQILGYDPDGIPLIRNAFGSTQWPLSSFLPGDITMHGDWGSGPAEAVLKQRPAMRITQPAGWQDVVSAP